MKTRVDSQVYFEEKIDIAETSQFISEMRKKKKLKIGYLHIIIAAMVRTISVKPRINRFVSGRKIYARNDISISLAVKKSFSEDAPETTIKVYFEPRDTIYDIVEKVNPLISENKNTDASNDTDKVAKWIMFCPGILIRLFIAFMNFLDNHGKMPKFLNKLSPFHSSLFITDLGSLGMEPVYHHIYEFGTTSLFLAFGNKKKDYIMDKEGNVVENKYINLKVVADERICDGYYFSTAFRIFRRLIENPQRLTSPPEEVYEDTEI